MIEAVNKEIDEKKDIIMCYKVFLEMAALKYDEESQRKDELSSELETVADRNSKMRDKRKPCEEDIRHEEEIRKRISSSYNVLFCYHRILKDLQESLNRCLTEKVI